jgi:hypothetical protein
MFLEQFFLKKKKKTIQWMFVIFLSLVKIYKTFGDIVRVKLLVPNNITSAIIYCFCNILYICDI